MDDDNRDNKDNTDNDKDEERLAPYVTSPPYGRNVDIKIMNRAWKAYWLYLEGSYSMTQIGEMVGGVTRQQVAKDLEWVREQMKFSPKTFEETVREIYIRCVFARNEIMIEARKAGTVYEKAKLWSVVADYDKKLLERFTQIQKPGAVQPDELGKLAIDFISMKWGGTALDEFKKFFEQRKRVGGSKLP